MTAHLLRFIGSNTFFKLIIVVAVVQGLWYALSFQPILFDEAKHLGFISMYTEQTSPFITDQDPKWDKLGDTTRDGSYLFYYLMSFLLRGAAILTDNEQVQVIILRLINIAVFVVGLYVFRRIFLKIRAGGTITNLSLLGFLLIPAFAPLPGIVTYDISSFTMLAIVLSLGVDILSSSKFNPTRFVLLLSVGAVASVIKFTSIVLVLPIILFVTVVYIKRHGKRIGAELKDSLARSSILLKAGLVVLLLVASGLLIERPLMNIVKYHSLTPDCTTIHSEQSCYKDYVSKRNQDFLASRPSDFRAVNGFAFLYGSFIPGMLKTLSQQWPFRGPLPLIYGAANALFLVSLFLIVFNLREILKNKYQTLFLLTIVFYVLILFAQLYASYVKLGQPTAISGRYLMPVAPLFILLFLVSLKSTLHTRMARLIIAWVAGTSIVILVSQGGGIITHAVSVNDDQYYWKNSEVRGVNTLLRSSLRQVVHDE